MRKPHQKNDMKLETLPPSFQPTVRSKRWRAPVIALIVIGLAGGGWTVLQKKETPPPAQAAPDGKKDKKEVFELSSGDIAAVGARSLAVSLPLSGSLAPLSSATIKSKVSGVVEATTLQEGMRSTPARCWPASTSPTCARACNSSKPCWTKRKAQACRWPPKTKANSQALLKQKYISQNGLRHHAKHGRPGARQRQIGRCDGRDRPHRADTVIHAPMAGVVSKRHVQAGEKVSPDMPVYTIVNLSRS
jgi:membrane fusion protein (multidrug efflux system)